MNQIRFSAEANRDIEEISNYLFDLNPADLPKVFLRR